MSAERNLPRVFVVDDEDVIATTLGMILRQHGFEAHSFNLPLEALRAAREKAPDLLISERRDAAPFGNRVGHPDARALSELQGTLVLRASSYRQSAGGCTSLWA